MARVLIVEDLPELAEELEAAVPAGNDVVLAVRSQDARDELSHRSADVVITALVLETGDYEDGIRVIDAALKSNPACRVIVVCSYSTRETCVAAIRAGAFAYIERNSPGIDFPAMLRWQVLAALATSPVPVA